MTRGARTPLLFVNTYDGAVLIKVTSCMQLAAIVVFFIFKAFLFENIFSTPKLPKIFETFFTH